jgi:chemotaxis protein methyltransferase CheR
VSPELKRNVHVRYLNLRDECYPSLLTSTTAMDFIFCRNVLIYFDAPMKSRILERFAEKMNLGGYLLLGGAETALGITNAFELTPNMRGVYRPARAVERRAVG